MAIVTGFSVFAKLLRMKGSEFYRHILGLESPWNVSDVDLDMTANRVVVRVEIDRSQTVNSIMERAVERGLLQGTL